MRSASSLFREAAGITDEWDEPETTDMESYINESLEILDRLEKGSPYPQDAKGKPIPPPPTPEEVERERKRRKRRRKR